MKSSYVYIIYTTPEKKSFSGILGNIDFYTIHFLFSGGKYLVEEQYEGKDAVEWYKTILEEQEIFIKSSKKQKFKNKNFIWLEVDSKKTEVKQFTSWTELDFKDDSTLAWKTVYYPCAENTLNECLGLAVISREIELSPKNKLNIKLYEVLDSILKSFNVSN